MKIDLTGLFNGSNKKVDIDYAPDLSVFNTELHVENVKVIGCLNSKADVVYLNLDISFTVNGVCDRCAEKVKKDYSVAVNRIVVDELQNENDDDNYIIVQNRELNVDELINEEIVLSIPSKFLCKEDCKGLCAGCGTNLNVKNCDCKKEVDPRMAALLQLLDED
ncbi:MAG: DUF177 domain-containing protein [Acetobacter sp.]|nr:DUF177 domain-containing protein [Bacteroides sp.]MCM1340541.1 DUF177 domain-containing protein [Acetobacter sp.]MCM1433281.1 DUF177 domain-containing protein [Clostridiales bacterium]